MAILYIDFENGNDNYGGTSFNLLASGTDGRITTATFSSTTANFPNDGSLINQYLSIFNGTIYAVYRITAWVSSTSLTIAALSGGTALANQTVDRQYYIGGRWQTFAGATNVRVIVGDDIRIKSSADPTSLGTNGTWTSSPLQPTINISSSTNATPIVVTCNAHGYANGDTIVITGHTINTNANGTWEISNVTTNTFTLVDSIGNGAGGATGTARLRNNTVVKLASPVTENIASTGNRGNGRTAWTQSTNVVASLNTSDYKEGDVSDSIAINATFTTGLAAFKSTGTLDLSGYQQVSFWIKQTAGTVTIAGDVSLRLCSDTAGVTTVHTIAIPALGALNIWNPVTVDLGVNLNSNIQSIALYVDADRGAVTFLLSNIIACKAKSSDDSLSLISLIGKNTGTEPWVAIQSINGTRVFLDGVVSNNPTTTSLMGYYGTSETVTTYKRETNLVITQFTIDDYGASSAQTTTLSGGWDRTNMQTQTGETYLDGRNNNIVCIGRNLNSRNYYWSFNRLSAYRFSFVYNLPFCYNLTINNIRDVCHNTRFCQALHTSTVNNIINLCYNTNPFDLIAGPLIINNITNINSNGSDVNTKQFTGDIVFCNITNIINICNNGGVGLTLNAFRNCNINNITNINYNALRAISMANCTSTIVSNIVSITGSASTGTPTANTYTNPVFLSACDNCKIINISSIVGARASAISNSLSFDNEFVNISTSGSTTSAFAADYGTSYVKNCVFGEPTLVTGLTENREGRVFLQNQNNNSNNHQIYMFGGVIASSTSVRNTNSGISWALSPTNSFRDSDKPVSLSLAKILVFANKLVTIKGMLRRTNTALTLRLNVKANQIAGVSNDTIASMSAAANTWEEVTLTFTPTENGVVELLGEAFGGTTHTGYIDDLTITQAT